MERRSASSLFCLTHLCIASLFAALGTACVHDEHADGAGDPVAANTIGMPAWSRGLTGSGANDWANSVAFDSTNDVVVLGAFEETVDLGDGEVTTRAWGSGYVAKYRADDGVLLWARSFDTSMSTDFPYLLTHVWPTRLAIDPDDNILVTGAFGRIADFGGGPLDSGDCGAGFVAKYSPDGTHLWSYALPRTLVADVGVDSTGAVFIAGDWYDSECPTNGPVEDRQVLVSMYTARGEPVWTRIFGDEEEQLATSIALAPDGDVVVAGSLLGSIDFGGGPLTVGYNPQGTRHDAFVARLSRQGEHIWSRRLSSGSNGTSRVRAIDVDSRGEVLVLGDFLYVLSLDDAPILNAGDRDSQSDLFVLRLDALGEHAWSAYNTRWGFASGYDFPAVGFDLAIGPTDEVYVAGAISGPIRVGGIDLGEGAFVVRYEQDGALSSTQGFARAGAAPTWALGISVGASGHVAISGQFSGVADFGSGELVSRKTDAFVATFAPRAEL